MRIVLFDGSPHLYLGQRSRSLFQLSQGLHGDVLGLISQPWKNYMSSWRYEEPDHMRSGERAQEKTTRAAPRAALCVHIYQTTCHQVKQHSNIDVEKKTPFVDSFPRWFSWICHICDSLSGYLGWHLGVGT